MQRKDLPKLIVLAAGAAFVSLIIAHFIFKAPPHTTTVPVTSSINASFPDVKNDPNYSSFLNSNSLDPTRLVQIGGSQNNSPLQ